MLRGDRASRAGGVRRGSGAGGSGSGRGLGARTGRSTGRVGRVPRRAGPVACPDGKRRKRETRRRVARRRARSRGGGRGRFTGGGTREKDSHERTRDSRVADAPHWARPIGGSVATMRYPHSRGGQGTKNNEGKAPRDAPEDARHGRRSDNVASRRGGDETETTRTKHERPRRDRYALGVDGGWTHLHHLATAGARCA